MRSEPRFIMTFENHFVLSHVKRKGRVLPPLTCNQLAFPPTTVINAAKSADRKRHRYKVYPSPELRKTANKGIG